MLRRLAKVSLGAALERAGRPGGPVILGYHRVVDDIRDADGALPGMAVSRRMLALHLDWLGERFRFVSLDELGERLGRGDAARGLAAVTFDDGYRDVYEHAFPLLRARGIPAALFVAADLVGTDAIALHDELYLLLARAVARHPSQPLDRLLHTHGIASPTRPALPARWTPYDATRLFLRTLPQHATRRLVAALAGAVGVDEQTRGALRQVTWEMLEEMQRAGMTVGSHTSSHVMLTAELPSRAAAELASSRRLLERRLETPVRHFAYPDGAFDPVVVRAVAEAGYRFAYTICRHRDGRHPLLTIPRITLWERSCLDLRGRFSPAVMSGQVRGIFGSRCRRDHAPHGGA